MNNVVKKIEKEIKKEHKSQNGSSSEHEGSIEPPKFHRDMRLICDVFRISERTRYALRRFDAARLEDFSLMTDEDFADMVVAQACIDKPLPPLQQRKLSILLSWVRSLPMPAAVGEAETKDKTDGFELKELKLENDGIFKASYKARQKKGDNMYIPSDWEKRFYEDLPRLRRELQQMGGKRPVSNWATEFLSLRWLFCG